MTTRVTAETLLDFIHEQILRDASTVRLDPDRPLLEDGVLDSVGLQQIVTFIECEWGITLDDEHFTPENFATVHAIVALIRVILGNGESQVRID